MIHDTQQYWQAVRAVEQGLPEFVWLASGNAVTEVPARIAAKVLHAGSHRIATAEEVEAQRAREAGSLKQAKHERMRRSGQQIVVVNETAAEEEAKPLPQRRRR